VADAVATTTPVAAVAPQGKRTGHAASPTESAELAATCRVLSTGHAASPTESAELAATSHVPQARHLMPPTDSAYD
jgi:hypothetical protein